MLGTAPSQVPLADLMAAGLGAPGRTVTAVLAVLLTMGTMNTYVAAATKLAGALADEGAAPSARPPAPRWPCSRSSPRRCSPRSRSTSSASTS